MSVKVTEWQLEAARAAQKRHNDFVLQSKAACEQSQQEVAELVQKIRDEHGVAGHLLLNLDTGVFEEPQQPQMAVAPGQPAPNPAAAPEVPAPNPNPPTQ